MFSPDILPLLILAGMAFLLYKAFRSAGDRPFSELLDAETNLARWQMLHEGIHPGDYPVGKRLAERYLDALIKASRTIPTMENDQEHLAKIEYAKRLAQPGQSNTFHATA